MQGTSVVGGLGPLAVDEERLADMPEGDFLDIAERRDGRVLAGALTCPGAQQGSEYSDAGMEIGHVRQGTASRTDRRASFAPATISVQVDHQCELLGRELRFTDSRRQTVSSPPTHRGCSRPLELGLVDAEVGRSADRYRSSGIATGSDGAQARNQESAQIAEQPQRIVGPARNPSCNRSAATVRSGSS